MGNIESLGHTRWNCKYHLVWIQKCRRKVLYGQLGKHLGQVFHELAGRKESKVLESHLLTDHVQMLASISPKYSDAQVVGFISGKSAIHTCAEQLCPIRTKQGCTSGSGAISFQL